MKKLILAALFLLAVIFLEITNSYPSGNVVSNLKEDSEINSDTQTSNAPSARKSHSLNKLIPRSKRGWIRKTVRKVKCFFSRCSSQSSPPPINGGWGRWFDLSSCSVSCGDGIRHMQRRCNDPTPQHGGNHCPGNDREVVPCYTNIPCPVNGGWTDWLDHGLCKASTSSREQLPCGNGVKKSSRTCSNPFPEHGGHHCAGNSILYHPCDAGECPGCFHPPVPPGVIYHTDSGTYEGSDQGDVAPGSNSSLDAGNGTDSTNTSMIIPSPDTDAVFEHKGVLSFGCKNGFAFEESPPGGSAFHTLKCTRGEWEGVTPVCNDINECTKDIHGCDPVRSNCTNTNGGFKCYCKEGYEKNDEGECKGVPIHGGWGVWIPSGICSVTCGGGIRRYERLCNNPPPSNGGLPCRGDDYKYEPCNTDCCPVHGEWSEWIDGACSKTCDYGVRKRYRSCEGPYCGGEECTGVEEIEVECNERPCQGCPIPVAPPGVEFHVPDGATEIQHEGKLSYTCGVGFNSVFDEETNSFPSIECKGGEWIGESPKCEDINECDLDIHSCNPETSLCVNILRGFKCFCKKGFKLADDGVTCKDINECEDNNGGCKEHCRNDFGTYQCYCPDGFELDEDGLSCIHPSSECSELPTPGNGTKNCTTTSFGLSCALTCNNGFEFSGSYDVSPQTCVDGIWRYELDNKEMPDCEAVEDTWFNFDTFLADLGDCDPSADYDTNSSDLFGSPSGFGFGSSSADCDTGSKKRSAGSLRVRLTLSLRVPRQCVSLSCRRAELRKLYIKAVQLRTLVRQNKARVTVTNRNTSASVVVPLTGDLDLRRGRLSMSCDPGSILVKEICVPCGQGYYYKGSTAPAKCEPCPFNTYQDGSGRSSCKKCPEGTYTNKQGSKFLESCLTPCQPGTFSQTRLSPCQKCPIGTYQNVSKANFCYFCDFGLVTNEEGATSVDDCGCPNGTYWQDCSRNCTCGNGGKCNIDGKCDCPRGWTGPNCLHPNPNSECQDTYFVKFINNYRAIRHRQILLLSADKKVDVDLFAGNETNTSHVVSSTFQMDPYVAVNEPISANAPFVYQISLYPYDKSVFLGYNSEFGSSDAFCGLPVQFLADNECEEYRAISTAVHPSLRRGFNSTVLVIGSQKSTRIEVTLTQDAVITVRTTGQITKALKGKKCNFTINRYDIIQINSQEDLTGTKIKAYRPVTVYSGHECGNVPNDIPGCDHMVEQLPPVNVWGHHYIATPFLRRTVDSFVKVVVTKDNTTFNMVCVDPGGNITYADTIGPLNSGEFYEWFVPAQEYLYIYSDKPLMVVHFITAQQKDDVGDPSMIVLPSTDNLVNNVTFYSLDLGVHSFVHFVNVIIPEVYSNPDFIILDGDPLSTFEYHSFSLASAFGDFVIYRIQLDPGYHTIHHTNPKAGFILKAYGLARGASYGYSPVMNQVMSCERKLKSF